MSMPLFERADESPAVATSEELHRLRTENERLVATLEAIQASRSWRLTAPLRVWAAIRRDSAVDRMVARHRKRLRYRHSPNVIVGEIPEMMIRRSATQPCVGAIVHVFYPELADELVERLAFIRDLRHVFVTYPSSIESLKIQTAFAPLATLGVSIHITAVENRGRDVLPFVLQLHELEATDCNAFIKLHTKRSPHLQGDTGTNWRRSLIEGLCPGPEECSTIATLFANNPDLLFAVPQRWAAGSESWGRNRKRARSLARRADLKLLRHIAFPAGSMFWFGRPMISALLDLRLVPDDFEPEAQQLDGTTAHALERMIGGFAAYRSHPRLLFDPMMVPIRRALDSSPGAQNHTAADGTGARSPPTA